MADLPGHLNADELVEVAQHAVEPLLRALEVAIYVEDAVDVLLPDDALNDAGLGSPASVVQTVTRLLEDA